MEMMGRFGETNAMEIEPAIKQAHMPSAPETLGD